MQEFIALESRVMRVMSSQFYLFLVFEQTLSYFIRKDRPMLFCVFIPVNNF